MTDNQKILVQKELLRPKAFMQTNIRGILRGQIDDHTNKYMHIEEEHRRLRQLDLEEKEKIRMEKIKKNLAMSTQNDGVVTQFLPLLPSALNQKQNKLIDNNNLENNIAMKAVLEKKR